MAGTKEGALKGRETILKRHGKNFYKEIGAKGGKATTGNKGFALMDKDRLREISSKAGKRSAKAKKRYKTLPKEVTGGYEDIPLKEKQ